MGGYNIIMSEHWKPEPRDELGRWTKDGQGFYRTNTRYEYLRSINFFDGVWPRSVGAKWENYEIEMPDGSKASFAEGSRIQDKEIIAGDGKRRKIDEVDGLCQKYGGISSKWTKIKAKATMIWKGKTDAAEVHWYEEPSVGKVKFKFKEWI